MQEDRKWPILVGLLLLPVVVHSAAMSVSALGDGFHFRKLDLAVLLATVAYLCAIAFVAGHRKYLSRFVLAVYATLITLGVAEGVAELLMPRPPANVPCPPGSRVSVAADTMPGISGTIEFSVNDLGLRGPQVRLEEVDLNVLCVGGSTTECMYVTDRLSWPWRLQDKLAARLEKEVFVGNAGRPGHFTLNHEYLLRNYELVPQFDWVVVLCGVNDSGRFLRHNYESSRIKVPFETLTPTYRNDAYYRRFALTRLLRRCALRWKHPVDAILQDSAGESYRDERRRRRLALQKNTIRHVPPDLEAGAQRYKADIVKIIAACRDKDVRLLMLTQPTLWTKDLPPALDALLGEHTREEAYTPEVLEQIIASFNQTLLETCRQEQVPCVDLASMLPKDESVFYDDCHLNVSGCEKVAEIVCGAIVAQIEPGAQPDASQAAPSPQR